MLVTKRSSPTSWTLSPSLSVSSFQPSQSSSARPSSIETMGYWRAQSSQKSTISSLEVSSRLSDFLKTYLLVFLVVELAGGGVERDGDLLAGLVAGRCDGFEDELEGFVVGLEVGREAAFVADGGVVALLLEHALEGVEDLGAPAERFGEASRRRRA